MYIKYNSSGYVNVYAFIILLVTLSAYAGDIRAQSSFTREKKKCEDKTDSTVIYPTVRVGNPEFDWVSKPRVDMVSAKKIQKNDIEKEIARQIVSENKCLYGIAKILPGVTVPDGRNKHTIVYDDITS